MLDLAQHPLERLAVEVVLLEHAPGRKVGAQVDAEEQSDVLLRLPADRVVAADDAQALAQRGDGADDLGRRQVGRLAVVDVEDLLRVLDDAADLDRQEDLGVVGLVDERAEDGPVGLELAVLVVEHALELARRRVDAGLEDALAEARGRVGRVDVVRPPKVGVAEDVRVQPLLLERAAVHPVLAVGELDDVAERVADRAVVLDHDVLERLDEPTLDVARLGRLNRRVDQTLATGHGVEEELLRREPAQVRVLHEAARLGRIVVLGEVRQRAVLEAERDPLALDRLLTDTGRHLRDVDERCGVRDGKINPPTHSPSSQRRPSA